MKKKSINILLLIIITFVVLFFALKDDYRTIMDLLLRSDVRFLFLGFLLTMAYCFMKATILHDIITQIKPFLFIESMKLQLMTFFFNAVTPFATGGQPFQVYMLRKKGIKVSYGTNVITQESMIHQISILLLGFITLGLNAIFHVCEVNSFMLYLILLGFIMNFIVLVVLFVLAYVKKADEFLLEKGVSLLYTLHIIKNKEKKLTDWRKSLENFNECSHIMWQDKKRLVKLILSNLLGLIAIYLVPLAVLYSFHEFTAYDGITALVLTTFVSLISSFVPLPGGTGGQEYVFILLFGLYIQKPLLTSVMLLWRFITYYLPMVIGAVLVNVKKKE